MKSVLLANLGNRNLYYRNGKGDYLTIVNYIKEVNLQPYILLNETFATEEYDFKQFTKDIWEQMEAGVFDNTLIEPRTLTISDLCERPYDRVYLYYTDQPGSKFAYQDTLYEALILQRLFTEAIPGLPVELVLVPGNPSDEKNLYLQYKPIIKSLLKVHPKAQVVFHDVGGTTQMKLVIKVLLEYYLRQQNRHLTIRYKDHWSEDARESDRTLHSRYVLLDTSREFINHFQFGAALIVLRKIADTDVAIERLSYHTQLAADRLGFRLRPSPTEYSRYAGSPIPVFADWSKKQIPHLFLPDLPFNERVNLFEFAALCDFYFSQKNYTLGVITYYRFCEEMSQAFVRAEGNYSLEGKENRDQFVKQVYPEVQSLLTGSKGPQYGVPVLLAYAYKKASPERLRKAYELMLPTISHVNGTTNSGMNFLRNECWLAHNNQTITEHDIRNEVPGFIHGKNIFKKLFHQIGFPKENVIVGMQNALLAEINEL